MGIKMSTDANLGSLASSQGCLNSTILQTFYHQGYQQPKSAPNAGYETQGF